MAGRFGRAVELRWGRITHGRTASRDGLLGTVVDFGMRAQTSLAESARVHAVRELRLFAPGAADVARGVVLLRPNVAELDRLATGLVDRIGGHQSEEAWQASRIVETEAWRWYVAQQRAIHAALVRGAGETYETPGAQERKLAKLPAILMVWDATLDKRTCPVCAALDGMIRPLGAYFDGHADPPLHPHCRCQIGYWPIAISE